MASPGVNVRFVLAGAALLAAVSTGCDRKSESSAGEFGVRGASAPTPTSVGALTANLQDDDAAVRLRAATALRAMTHRAVEARGALVAATRDEDANVRAEACHALGALGPDGGDALIHALKHDVSDNVRSAAASSLGAVGPAHPGGLGALSAAIEPERSPVVRAQIVAAMERFGPAARQALARAHLDDSALVRDRATIALERLDRGAQPTGASVVALSDLTRRLAEGDSMSRIKAAQDLGRMGPAAAPAIPALAEALRAGDRAVRVAAAGALRLLGREAVPALLTAAKDKDASVRSTAAQGLGRLSAPGRDNRDILVALAALLQDDEMGVRATAVVALEQVGPEAAPALRRAVEDSDWFVRDRAKKALAKVAEQRVAGE